MASVPKSRLSSAGSRKAPCLALEFVVRASARYGAVAGLSGGLIGPPGTVWPQSDPSTARPCSSGAATWTSHPQGARDGIRRRVAGLGAEVTAVLYPNMDHTVNEDEMIHLQGLVDGLWLTRFPCTMRRMASPSAMTSSQRRRDWPPGIDQTEVLQLAAASGIGSFIGGGARAEAAALPAIGTALHGSRSGDEGRRRHDQSRCGDWLQGSQRSCRTRFHGRPAAKQNG
jgi:hypothetical protein